MLKGLKGYTTMKEVYKITGDFKDDTFELQLNKVNKYYDFMYLDDTLFLALRNYKDLEVASKLVHSTFKPTKEYLIQEIESKHTSRLPEHIISWVKDHMVNLDSQRYEDKEQARLQSMMEILDNIDQDLNNELKKGGI